jgi:hypothetical protein
MLAYNEKPDFVPIIFKDRAEAVSYLNHCRRYDYPSALNAKEIKAVGIMRVRANKRNVWLQKWLKDNSI